MESPSPTLPGMVGRVRPLAELDELLAAVLAGRGRAAVVLGEPGMGKTTLAEALADRARQAGAAVAWGWCTTTEMPPFWPWRTILRELAPDHRLATDRSADPAGLNPIGLLRGEAGARATLFVSTVDTLRDVCRERPAVLVVEDLQWADGASLQLLRTVIDALPGLPALVLATCRDDPLETSDEVLEWVRALPTAVERLRLDGLAREEVGELVARVLGRPAPGEVAAAVHDRTGGNPYFVREVSRLLAARPAATAGGVPEGVREVLARRIARISQNCQRTLEIAAVAGDGASLSLVASVAGRTEPVVVEVLQEAVAARLLADTPGDGAVRFGHALVREVLESTLGAARRAELHRAVAERLEARADPASVAGELARHWSRALAEDAAERAAAWALTAARSALAGMGYEQAVDFYRLALRGEDIERTKVMLELGEAQTYAGDLDGARRTFAETAELARVAGRASYVALAALGFGTGLSGFEVPLHDDVQIELLEDALALLPDGDGGLRAAVMGRLSLAYGGTDRDDRRLVLSRAAVDMSDRVRDPCVQAGALAAYCDAIAGPDHVAERFAAASRMLRIAEHGRDTPCQLLARRLRLMALMERGDWSAVDTEVEAYARTAARLAAPLYSWYVPLWRGARELLAGDVDTALRYASEAEELGFRAGSENARLLVLALRWWTSRARGIAPVDLTGEIHEAAALAHHSPPALALTAAHHAVIGKTDTAARVLDRLIGSGLDALPRDCEWLETLWSVGDAAIMLGRRDVAEDVATRLGPYQEVWAVDGIGGAVIGVVAEALGRLAGFQGRADEAGRLLTRAIDIYRGCGAELLRERAERMLAEVTGHAPKRAVTPALTGLFHRDGRTWQVRWRDQQATAPDSKGMRDLAVLLARPGEPVHVLDLVAAAGGASRGSLGSDTGPVLDGTARAAYKRRLAELEREVAEAEDDGRLPVTLIEERDFLVRELATAYGLGGRARITGDPAERARKAVAMRIRTAVATIREVHPSLARHLELAVSTGRFCVYRPEEPVTWRSY